MGRVAALAFCLVCALMRPGQAQESDPATKFRVEGDRLVYNTEGAPEGGPGGIEDTDVDVLIATLRAHPEVKTLELDSGGGSVWAADRMAGAVIDFELDTHVNGSCTSSCVTVFLGGARRTMSRGSRIGFHQIQWSASSIERFYESEREIENWRTPFDFASWIFADTQNETYHRLMYMVSRGVDPLFAIETLRTPSSDTWEPWRARLLAAGVLTE